MSEQQLDLSVEQQVKQLLLDQEVQSLLLQPLVASVALLHQHHDAQQQRQRRKAGPLQCVLSIPDFHQDLPLPGGQAFVDAAAAEIVKDDHPGRRHLQHVGASKHDCWVPFKQPESMGLQ